MRAYSAESLEAVRTRDLLKDWAGEGFITQAQYEQLQQETACHLRRTNIFLRLVLFFFTLLIIGAAIALFGEVFFPHAEAITTGILVLFASAATYGASEVAVSQGRLYRYGIEEALLACSIAFLCFGVKFAFFGGFQYSPHQLGDFVVPAAGCLLSLWIWYRFTLPYAPIAAMIFVHALPAYWTSSQTAQHLIVAAIYALGLFIVVKVRANDRLTYLNETYSIAEALAWFGIYLMTNLRLSSLNLLSNWWGDFVGGNLFGGGVEFPKPFYWTTWVLIWCLPPVILARGIRQKDRLVMASGIIATLLTFITNKPYLGWPRHTWDPMLLGGFVVAVALFTRRWLAQGPDQTRHGFTPRRLSGKDKQWITAGTTAMAFTPTPAPQSPNSDIHFGGGDFGGGGASSDF